MSDAELLLECQRFLEDMHSMPVDWTIKESQDLHAKVKAKLAASVAQPEFKASATRIVYRPKRGRKGVMCITSWMPLGDFPPNVGEVLEETTLYERKAAPGAAK